MTKQDLDIMEWQRKITEIKMVNDTEITNEEMQIKLMEEQNEIKQQEMENQSNA